MPVDQTGENILFVMDGQTVEAHVQIQYQGDAERFAWVVPMQKIPEVTVGSQRLFANLLANTVPTFSYAQQTDVCGGGTGGGTGGSLSTGGTGGASSGGSAGGGGGPSVVFQKTVGAFEVTVLQGGTAQEVGDWLTTNNYQQIPNAAALLQQYVERSFVFAAIKLTAGAGTEEIHPLVFKYEGNEPCVPIVLTAVAATEDMGVRTFFLGDDRVVPVNYKHVVLNPVRIDWQSFASNYTQAVSRGADSPISNGQGFVTEYAGTSGNLQPGVIHDPNWVSAPFESIAPELVVQTLNAMNVTQCFPSFCQYLHPLILPILQEYLPLPASLIGTMTEDEWYANLTLNAADIDLTKWDAAGFAQDFKDRIEDPGKHAVALIQKWPYLTRLFTTISPSEMTLDPVFMAWPGLPTVNAFQQATRRTTCSGNSVMLLPDDREVALDPSGFWPVWDSQMPWAEKIEEYQADGDVVTLVNNTATIDAQLLAWNESRGWSGNGGGGSGGEGGNFVTGGTGGKPNGGIGDSTSAFGGGCGCGIEESSNGGVAFLLGLGALGLLRRRR
jgi:MYXO-CTERM domain-containing protein